MISCSKRQSALFTDSTAVCVANAIPMARKLVTVLTKLHRAVRAGIIVYHGPREDVVPFFDGLGFEMPERKGVADFLQEITSRKDQKVCDNMATCPGFISEIQTATTVVCRDTDATTGATTGGLQSAAWSEPWLLSTATKGGASYILAASVGKMSGRQHFTVR